MMRVLHTDLLAVVGVRAIEELDAREGAGELAAAGDPGDGGALVKEEAGVEELDALLLDEAHTQHLALLLIGNQLCGQHLQACLDITALYIGHSTHAQVAFLQSLLCSLICDSNHTLQMHSRHGRRCLTNTCWHAAGLHWPKYKSSECKKGK